MKVLSLTLALLAGALFAKAQTSMIHVQNSNPCPVYYVLYAGNCANPQVRVPSDLQMVPGNVDYPLFFSSVAWMGPVLPGYGFTGMRVYSDDPTTCGTATFIDVMAPTSGPLPALGGPLFPTCSGCPPIRTFFETYCGGFSNIFRFL